MISAKGYVNLILLIGVLIALPEQGWAQGEGSDQNRPNILLAISDDHSYPYASAYRAGAVHTPAFDRVASEGVLFNNAFVASPGCSPSRAALLTGRYPWQLEHAGTHASSFPQKYVVFPNLLAEAGYHVGHTGKGWGPGNWKENGRAHNPAGPAFENRTLVPPHEGISSVDYAGNFADFLTERSKDQPFFFWYGAHEPHLSYERGMGRATGKNPAAANVPPFLPDAPAVRTDLLDHAVEIEWFDRHLGQMLRTLEAAGELGNTIIVVTGDNGMPFPRAKANVYEYGIHVPLAIRWGQRVPGGREVDDLVSLIDLMPTFLEAAGVDDPPGSSPMAGRSLMNILTTDVEGRVDSSREGVFAARERHSSSRFNSLAYPQRALRTDRYLYIRNFAPERWPAGAPQKYEEDGRLGPMHGAYHDIDGSTTKTFLVNHRDDPAVSQYFHWAVDRRPDEELYDVRKDPGCLNNLAGNPAYADVQKRLRNRMNDYLRKTGDPRVTGRGNVFETYKRYSHLRKFPVPDWAQGQEDVFRPAWLPPRDTDY